MAAIVELRPLTERGAEILDELEMRTKMQPFEMGEQGARRYHLSSSDAGVDGFDPMLEKIDPSWREHVSR